jgi:hypothetical protein
MRSFLEFMNESKYRKTASPTDLKVGDVVLDGPEDTPYEVLAKAKQDGTGYWVQVRNQSTGKKDKIYIDSGDTIPMNEWV